MEPSSADSDRGDPSPRGRYWTRLLLANAAGALAVVGISGGFSPSVPWRATLRALGLALIYANCIGLSMSVVIRSLGRRLWEGRGRWAWMPLIATMIAVTAAGTAVAT